MFLATTQWLASPHCWLWIVVGIGQIQRRNSQENWPTSIVDWIPARLVHFRTFPCLWSLCRFNKLAINIQFLVSKFQIYFRLCERFLHQSKWIGFHVLWFPFTILVSLKLAVFGQMPIPLTSHSMINWLCIFSHWFWPIFAKFPHSIVSFLCSIPFAFLPSFICYFSTSIVPIWAFCHFPLFKNIC